MRTASISRKTTETAIACTVNLDGNGTFDQDRRRLLRPMMELFSRHSLIDITLKAKATSTSTSTTRSRIAASPSPGGEPGAGRPARHPPLCLLRPAHGRDADPRGDRRFGAPLPRLNCEYPRDKIGEFDTELVREWFQAFAMNSGITLHLENTVGGNAHHIAESSFKAGPRLRDALEIDPRQKDASPPQGISQGMMKPSSSTTVRAIFTPRTRPLNGPPQTTASRRRSASRTGPTRWPRPTTSCCRASAPSRIAATFSMPSRACARCCCCSSR